MRFTRGFRLCVQTTSVIIFSSETIVLKNRLRLSCLPVHRWTIMARCGAAALPTARAVETARRSAANVVWFSPRLSRRAAEWWSRAGASIEHYLSAAH